MKRLLKKYERFFTWSHPLGEEVIAHQDGAVSLLIEWQGLDMEMCSEQERLQHWATLYRCLEQVGGDYCLEFHLWREHDPQLAQAYLAKGADMVRGIEFGQIVREAQARHLSQYAMVNSVGLIVTRLPQKKRLAGVRAQLKHQARLGEDLREQALKLVNALPGASIAPFTRYLERIAQSVDRNGYTRGARTRHDPQLLITEQMLREAPTVVQGAVTFGEPDNTCVTKVLYVHLYPDSRPAWFTGLAPISATLHVSHVIRPADTASAMRRAERETDLLEGTASNRGQDYTAKGLSDLAAFRRMVADHDLAIFHNAYIIHLHGTRAQVKHAAEEIKHLIDTQGGQVRDADYMQLPFFRAAQPGQGYRTPIFRPDHTWQVADMVPVQVYRRGDAHVESLRLGHASQLIGFDLSHQSVAHAVTVAMTGAGKGVDKVTTIAETYPLNVDWYIAEIGTTYQWVVEAFGGTYTRIDPDHTVINPLPRFGVADRTTPLPLDSALAGGTLQALAFLLTDGATTLDVHSAAAAEMALQMLYANPGAPGEAPTLEDYLKELERADYFEHEDQALAAKRMGNNLHSFLCTTAGRIFTRRDNLELSPGITGVDLKDVGKASPQLLKFYLVFLSLRMAHMAFYTTANPARVLLDEMHEFVRVYPEVVGALISGIARMGRKENAAIDIVTQGIREIDVIEKEVLNSMPLRSLLYRADEWDEIASRINMPARPLEVWKQFEYPLERDYRPALRSVGNCYYRLHLVYPDLLLDLADTSPAALALKASIAQQTRDPLERLELLRHARQMKEAAHA